MYGYKSKIGLLVPSLNTTMEYDFNRMAPEGVSVHVSRVPTEVEGSLEALQDMAASAKASAVLVADVHPDVVVFGCTSASFVNGAEFTESLEAGIAEVVDGAPVVSTASAMLQALEHVGAKKVSVLTPYVGVTNERLRAYLTAAGIEIVDLKGMEILDMYSHADIASETIAAETKALNVEGADAVFIACTQLKTIDVVDELERALQIPVITAVQSSFWAALRAAGGAGLPITGYGKLLAE